MKSNIPIEQRVGGWYRGKRPAAGLKIATPVAFESPGYIGNDPYALPADDQGQSPKCTAEGMCGILQASWWAHAGYKLLWDTDKFYAHEKASDNDGQDGSSLETAIITAQFDNCVIPRQGYPSAPLPKITAYEMTEPDDITYFLHEFDFVLLAMQITKGWENPREPDGLIQGDTTRIGGHCVFATWFDLHVFSSLDLVGIKQSWGREYGNDGGVSIALPRFCDEFAQGYGLDIDWGPRFRSVSNP